MGKIVFIHLLNDYSGSPRVLAKTIEILKKYYKVGLFINKGSQGFLSNLDVPTYLFPYSYHKNRFLTLLELVRSQIYLFFALYKHRKDSIFYINTFLPFGAAIAGKIFGVKVVYHIHETYIRPPLLKKFLRFVAQSTSSAFIFVSRFLQNVEGFPDTPSVYAYNVLDDAFVEKAKRHVYSLNQPQFNVLMLCSLKDYKGVPEFLKLAEGLVSNNNIKLHLVLNSDAKAIQEYFVDKTISSNTTVYPATGDVHQFYEMASLVVNLSRTDKCIEAFGLTLLEAMSYGIPVIGPPVGGPTELIKDGVNGYMMDSRNPKEIAGRILELVSNPQLCLKLSDAARQTAHEFNPGIFEANVLKALSYASGPLQ